jgi:hypothetical protein
MESRADLKIFVQLLRLSEDMEEAFCLHHLIKDDRGMHQIPSKGRLRPPFVHWLPIRLLTTSNKSFLTIFVASFVKTNELNWLEIGWNDNVFGADVSVGIASFIHVLHGTKKHAEYLDPMSLHKLFIIYDWTKRFPIHLELYVNCVVVLVKVVILRIEFTNAKPQWFKGRDFS